MVTRARRIRRAVPRNCVAVAVGADATGGDCRIERAVDEFIAERNAAGDDVPVPLTERPYSGRFVVRTSPALHARLAVEAAEQSVSMNQWVVQKLAQRPLGGNLFDVD